LTRAIKSGRLSASRRDDGGYLINVAELERVFPLATAAATADVAHHATPDATAAIFEAQIAGLREVGDLLRRQLDDRDRQLDDVREDRDRWRAAFENTQRLLPVPVERDATPDATPQGNGFVRAWRWMRKSA
jgi:hypothetical protein